MGGISLVTLRYGEVSRLNDTRENFSGRATTLSTKVPEFHLCIVSLPFVETTFGLPDLTGFPVHHMPPSGEDILFIPIDHLLVMAHHG